MLTQIDELYSRFKEKAEAISAKVYRVSNTEDVGGLVVELLKEVGAKKIALCESGLSKEAKLAQLLINQGFSVHSEKLRIETPNADVGISQLEIAISETGSLAQDAINVDSRLVSSLPLVHIALVPTSGLVPTLDEAVSVMYNGGNVPGYISFITGPSRTSDIERVLTIGVHGPEQVLIVFVDKGGGF